LCVNINIGYLISVLMDLQQPVINPCDTIDSFYVHLSDLFGRHVSDIERSATPTCSIIKHIGELLSIRRPSSQVHMSSSVIGRVILAELPWVGAIGVGYPYAGGFAVLAVDDVGHLGIVWRNLHLNLVPAIVEPAVWLSFRRNRPYDRVTGRVICAGWIKRGERFVQYISILCD
jgi:hypothetical protein